MKFDFLFRTRYGRPSPAWPGTAATRKAWAANLVVGRDRTGQDSDGTERHCCRLLQAYRQAGGLERGLCMFLAGAPNIAGAPNLPTA